MTPYRSPRQYARDKQDARERAREPRATSRQVDYIFGLLRKLELPAREDDRVGPFHLPHLRACLLEHGAEGQPLGGFLRAVTTREASALIERLRLELEASSTGEIAP